MRTLIHFAGIVCLACVASAQMTNDVPDVAEPAKKSVAPLLLVDTPFVAPPVMAVPSVTSDVVVVETVVTTNIVTTLTTNRVERRAQVVTTNATLRRFVIDIDTNQEPTRFTSYMSDGSVVVTSAGNVGSLTNRIALSTFNGLLRDVISNGRRNVNTNAMWRARGTNDSVRLQRVWSAGGASK